MEDRTDAGQWRDSGTEGQRDVQETVHRALEHVRNSKREEQSPALAAPKDMPEWEEDLGGGLGRETWHLAHHVWAAGFLSPSLFSHQLHFWACGSDLGDRLLYQAMCTCAHSQGQLALH